MHRTEGRHQKLRFDEPPKEFRFGRWRDCFGVGQGEECAGAVFEFGAAVHAGVAFELGECCGRDDQK